MNKMFCSSHVKLAQNTLLFRESCFILHARCFQEKRLSSPRKLKKREKEIDKGIEGTKKFPKVKDPEAEFLKLWRSTENKVRSQLGGSMVGKRMTRGRNKDRRKIEATKEGAFQDMDDDDFGFRVPKFSEIVRKLNLGRKMDKNQNPSFGEEEEKEKTVVKQVLKGAISNISFEDIGVHPKLIKRLQKNGIVKPVFIQERALPLIYDNRSILIKSETGSGKTLVFLLPTLQDPGKGYGTVIVVPTRELASQMLYEAHRLLGDKSIVASFVSYLRLRNQLNAMYS